MKKKKEVQDHEYETDGKIVTAAPGVLHDKEEAGDEGKIEEKDGEQESDTIGDLSPRQLLARDLFEEYPLTRELLEENPHYPLHENLTRMVAAVEGYARGSGCDKSTLDSALRKLFEIGMGCQNGTVTLDMIEVVLKGERYDRTLAEEVKAAEIRGRNARIEAKVRSTKSSDGIPHPESRATSDIKRNRGIFSLAESARNR